LGISLVSLVDLRARRKFDKYVARTNAEIEFGVTRLLMCSLGTMPSEDMIRTISNHSFDIQKKIDAYEADLWDVENQEWKVPRSGFPDIVYPSIEFANLIAKYCSLGNSSQEREGKIHNQQKADLMDFLIVLPSKLIHYTPKQMGLGLEALSELIIETEFQLSLEGSPFTPEDAVTCARTLHGLCMNLECVVDNAQDILDFLNRTKGTYANSREAYREHLLNP